MLGVFEGVRVYVTGGDWIVVTQERAILTTMDITTDGFGFMLAFGDLSWVPFTYTLQARYLVRSPRGTAPTHHHHNLTHSHTHAHNTLSCRVNQVEHDPNLPLWAYAAIAVMNFVGYSIFRGANSQKDAFRRDPNSASVKHLSFMQTKRGTKLITSGYWGLARKINYTGDWLMGLSWCALCGTGSLVPYFYAIYFGVLLVHRALRDDGMCHAKYGPDWLEYKKRVPYIFIPGVI